MIRSVIVMNDQGKPRLVKFYEYQVSLWRNNRKSFETYIQSAECEQLFSTRLDFWIDHLQDTRLVYKTFATQYIIVIFDDSENELAILDLMQVFVEMLDKCFSNVCELDMVFNFNKVHTILDEIILGGQVVEMISSEVVKAVDEITWMQKNPNSIIGVPKSISG